MNPYIDIKYLYCMNCGQRYPVGSAYLNSMVAAKNVHCSFCRSPEVLGLSDDTWNHWQMVDSMTPIDVQIKNLDQLIKARELIDEIEEMV